MDKKYPAVDIMKFVCSFLVIVVHTSPLLPYSYLGNFILINIIGRIVVPFFFISTAFFVRRNTIKRGNLYFKKYIIALIKLYLFWSLIYLPIGIQWIQTNFHLPWFLYPVALLVALFYIGTYFHLWYIPALIFSLVIIHFLAKHFSFKVLFIISFGLLCIGALETYYGVISNQILLNIIDNYMKFFVTTRNGFFFGLFYVTCGYYLAKDQIFSNFKYNGSLSIVFAIALVIEAFSLYKTDSINFNFLIMAAPFTFFFFQYLRTIDVPWKFNYQKIREYTNLYYFTHAMFLVLIPFILSLFDQKALFDQYGFVRFFSVLIGTHIISTLIYHFKNSRLGKMFRFI
ncbi:MAG: acyltransferase family protein [Erysipelotrichaceae bacterium]